MKKRTTAQECAQLPLFTRKGGWGRKVLARQRSRIEEQEMSDFIAALHADSAAEVARARNEDIAPVD